ncbi:cytochrome oxidase biogenesis protein Sco1/SenC/PrrC, putative copper metallochaperone [Geomicrobium sp. JCM 19037]|uniref:SCO family protein n=1 Tax=Geomicrobium sp. JCM 19037 TaxID=1460634 RepID=UPI00045F1880|nr:SCO family protein [Geomicrobium sp. JCM 19037]GAK05761.1 cytochrome oxidase biogenesis protein Sco1/SenC/PrrC, putative copper metallochaperone [Geomicrobium sp. JCM 19037]
MKQQIIKTASIFMLAVVLSGCGWLYDTGGASSENGQDTSDLDLEMIEFTAVNQFEEEVTEADMEGKYSVVNMAFTRCPSVCTMLTPNMGMVQDGIEEEGIDASLYTFTVDPEFDSPERLEHYGEAYAANFDVWQFLTGYELEDIQQIANETFNSVVQPAEDDIMHTTYFFIVDPNNQVIRFYDGLADDVSPIVEDLKELTNE